MHWYSTERTEWQKTNVPRKRFDKAIHVKGNTCSVLYVPFKDPLSVYHFEVWFMSVSLFCIIFTLVTVFTYKTRENFSLNNIDFFYYILQYI